MSDTTSSGRTTEPSPASGSGGKPRAEVPSAAVNENPAVEDDQPTIISHRSPMATPAISDSAYRILQGKVLPGDRLGHFELVQYVGGGGMGRVFRAVDTSLARTVAVKILAPDQAVDEDTLLRFKTEAQSAARLDHENIARVYHVGEDRGLNYIVFEFIEGINIRTLVEQKGPLPLDEAVSYTLQVAEALNHAAEHDVVHRDIKPSNVLITAAGHVKLIDMGLARLQQVDTSAEDLTASGVTLGTFDYISPEQARDPRTADARSDLYSLGCTFFYMLTGRPPFPEGTVLQKLLQHQGDQPPDVRQFRPNLPEEVARTLKRMLAKDPRNRYGSPVELVDDLLLIAEQVGLRPVGLSGRLLVAPREPAVSFLRRHLPWIVPSAALMCIVLVLHFIWSFEAGWTPKNASPLPSTEGQTDKLPHSQIPDANSGAGGQNDAPPAAPAAQPADDATSELPVPVDTVVGAGGGTPQEPGEVVTMAPRDTRSEATGTERPPEQAATHPLRSLNTDHSEVTGIGFDTIRGGMSPPGGLPAALKFGSGSVALSGRLSGASGAADDSTDAVSGGEPMPKRTGLLVVNGHAQNENEFLTLGAACNAAVNGDVIELRYDGNRQQRPIKLANVKVTIRAGEGYRPVIVFRPLKPDPVKYPGSMFTLTAGRLTLVNLALQMYIPREVPTEHWSLFESRSGQTVRLEDCSLTICNASDQLDAYHQKVAFFRACPAPGADTLIGNGNATTSPLVTIELVDCVARGEADFLRAPDLQPIRLVWDNGLLVTTERLLSAGGGQRSPQPGQSRRIDLRHLTAVVRGGLCLTSSNRLAPHQLTTEIHCADSILKVASAVPLIEQVGVEGKEYLRRQIVWNGDRNFYEDCDVFWMVRNVDPEVSPQSMSFDAWQAHWGPEQENLPSPGGVDWQKPADADRVVHSHLPEDYALAESTEADRNPAIGAAADGRNAGFQADRLPPLPALPTAEGPAGADQPD